MTDSKKHETWLYEKAGRAHAVKADHVHPTLAELLAEAEDSGAYPLPSEEREWVDAPAVGREVLTPFDLAE